MLKPSVEPIVISDTLKYQCNQNKCRILLTMLISKQINHYTGTYVYEKGKIIGKSTTVTVWCLSKRIWNEQDDTATAKEAY